MMVRMIERLRRIGARCPEETRELVVGTALVATVVADYLAYVRPSPVNLRAGLILTAAVVAAAAAFSVYAFTARETTPYLVPVSRPRFGRLARASAVGALVVTAAAAALLLREVVTYAAPDIPVYVFNNTGRPIRISAGAAFVLDAATAASDATEPSRGTLLLRADERGGRGTPDILVGPHTAVTAFGEVIDPARYRRALGSGTTRITVIVELKSPLAGVRLTSNACSVPESTAPAVPCALRLG